MPPRLKLANKHPFILLICIAVVQWDELLLKARCQLTITTSISLHSFVFSSLGQMTMTVHSFLGSYKQIIITMLTCPLYLPASCSMMHLVPPSAVKRPNPTEKDSYLDAVWSRWPCESKHTGSVLLTFSFYTFYGLHIQDEFKNPINQHMPLQLMKFHTIDGDTNYAQLKHMKEAIQKNIYLLPMQILLIN